jgi:catechol 2,3-dioxygenase-like lactoylglutathione lyase family enzyme
VSVYWKIGIGLEDVALGQTKIMTKGTQVSDPHQFQEIGYLCHLKDSAGFSLELLQDTFEKNFVKPAERPEMTLGQPGKIGQITIRSSNIDKTLALYEKILGMKMLSIQEVSQYGFTLYFLAYTDESPPNPDDLNAVDNREWLWQRPYTTLEIQYKPGFELTSLDPNHGVGGMELSLSADPRSKLDENKISYKELGDGHLEVTDPDGFTLYLKY